MFCVRIAGGRPVWLGPGRATRQIDTLDGLIITGGSDIDPTAYGSSDKPWSPPDVERDLFELDALAEAEAAELPILGICRGSQLLNVRRGGNLHGDIVGLRRFTRNYRTLLPRRPVVVAERSDLAAVLGREQLRINALHHQAVRELGHGIAVVAHDEDGVVQGIEDPGQPFFIGVQWHPEYLFWKRPHQRLFHALVAAARDRRDR